MNDDNMAVAAAAGFRTIPGCTALVTGSSGICGARLVEMLLERGAKTVIGFDIVPPNPTLMARFRAAAVQHNLILRCGKEDGDLTNPDAVERAFTSVSGTIDVVFHVGALVGPFFRPEQYHAVNVLGTRHVIASCQKYHVRKLVFASSPSTRFHGTDIKGLREDQLTIPTTFLAPYAKSKAIAEQDVNDACKEDHNSLLTVCISPHQIYGPHDTLFLPNFLRVAGRGQLRIFGGGENLVSVCFVDNYCHGLLCGADTLKPDSPVLKRFYIITDGTPVRVWDQISVATVHMGFDDLRTKLHLPVLLLYVIAYLCTLVGYLVGHRFKLSPFNLRMMTIRRYFFAAGKRQ